eukprot:265721-Hanusia_phi.AAC.1
MLNVRCLVSPPRSGWQVKKQLSEMDDLSLAASQDRPAGGFSGRSPIQTHSITSDHFRRLKASFAYSAIIA